MPCVSQLLFVYLAKQDNFFSMVNVPAAVRSGTIHRISLKLAERVPTTAILAQIMDFAFPAVRL